MIASLPHICRALREIVLDKDCYEVSHLRESQPKHISDFNSDCMDGRRE
jgi:hypothetical protein